MKDVTDRLAKVRKKYNQILLELFAQSSVKIAGFLKRGNSKNKVAHDLLLENLLIVRKSLIHRYIKKTETAKGTNWEQKFQKLQNGNICLTNLNVENNGNFPILAFGDYFDNELIESLYDSSAQRELMLFCE